MSAYLNGTALLIGYADSLLGADVSPRWSKDESARRYEALKRLPVSELKARADRVIDSLKSWQSTIFSDANGRAYRAALDQAVIVAPRPEHRAAGRIHQHHERKDDRVQADVGQHVAPLNAMRVGPGLKAVPRRRPRIW